MEATLLRILSLLRRTRVYYINRTISFTCQVPPPPPTEAIVTPTGSQPRRQYLLCWQDLPRRQDLPEPGILSELEIPGIHPARFLLTPLAFPWRFPRYVATRLPRKGGYPRTREGLSLLPRIFRRHPHSPLGCQPQSPECSKYTQLTTICPRRTLPDSMGFPTGLPLI